MKRICLRFGEEDEAVPTNSQMRILKPQDTVVAVF